MTGALPADSGMAFILIQHLDPTHESVIVDLLAGNAAIRVEQAADGKVIERDHLYVIPPGSYLSVVAGALHLSEPQARNGARLPFDFLLNSLATEYGANAVAVVLSGSGSDGSRGLEAVKTNGGFVIAQDPDEAAFGSMPRSAIVTGAVDLVLPVAAIPGALAGLRQRMALSHAKGGKPGDDAEPRGLSEIIELLRTKTVHDFTPYKRGTLQRRIERRIALAPIYGGNMLHYLDILRTDAVELDLLAKDLLINVTSFFRDPKVFDVLTETIIPDIVRDHPADQPLRVWVAGCSTGEEAYSLAMLFQERILAAHGNIALQVFASDTDPDAINDAREGVYPDTIEADVSPERLARFFSKEDDKYRVLPELRAAVVFTVQDVLADPPFSRLDLVSCRNLLIYLRPEAQAKVISLFQFALRERGILLLGNSETVGDSRPFFEPVSKTERIYRHIGRPRPRSAAANGARAPARAAKERLPSREAALAELCQRMVMETCAPAAILVDRNRECLYLRGPTDRYIRVAPGNPGHDVLAMAREGVRGKLRSAMRRANEKHARIVSTGHQLTLDGKTLSFTIDVQPVSFDGEDLLLVCFLDEPGHERILSLPTEDIPRVAELEQELEVTRTELQGAIHNLEISSEEQKAINEEALSANEEYQSTNEELLASKGELQSLNEELTALNGQLQDALERQRTTANDLQNVLYSTDVATLFLDAKFNIRFFTPTIKSLFSVIPGDVGRPLADLSSLAADNALLADAQTVLQTLAPIEREIETATGAWYVRRISPFRAQDNGVEGVVITFANITERRHAADAIEEARRVAQLANIAKSRFLAAASHDLRQPLQTLSLIQGLLAKTVEGDSATRMVARLDETLSAMSGMLDALLDINQIEAGTVRVEIADIAVNELFDRIRNEFTLLARGQGLVLHVVPCSLTIFSDHHLLEQMIRNLLSNALKYTRHGKVLLGCRRHRGMLTIEVWDTGIGIPDGELRAIFEEYHQLDNPARERDRGLGLGLSIVQRLGKLLGHRVSVRSHQGKGSVFSIDIAMPPDQATPRLRPRQQSVNDGSVERIGRTGAILIVEDDLGVRELLELHLKDEDHYVVAAADGVGAVELVKRGVIRPDIILADYNLPNGMDGLEVAVKLRDVLQQKIPVIILTGDISTDTLRSIARQECLQLNKPIKLKDLTHVIQKLIPRSQPVAAARASGETVTATETSIVFVIDDDDQVGDAVCAVLEDEGRTAIAYSSCEAFLEARHPDGESCLLLDAYFPGMSGLELLKRLNDMGRRMPVIMMTGKSDVPTAVLAMKAGALDFIEKPIDRVGLLGIIDGALARSRDSHKLVAWRQSAASQIARLTERERRIMEMLLAGNANKIIAADLGISRRTVENHRASIMKKTGSNSLPALARLALAAGPERADTPLVRKAG